MPASGGTGEYSTLAQKYTNTATEANSLQYNLSTPLSGYYIFSSAYGQGSRGNWWSSTFSNSNGMYSLLVNPTDVLSSNNYSERGNGLSMRCLVAD